MALGRKWISLVVTGVVGVAAAVITLPGNATAAEPFDDWTFTVEVKQTWNGGGYDETFLATYIDSDVDSKSMTWTGSRNGSGRFPCIVGQSGYDVTGGGGGVGELSISSGPIPSEWGLVGDHMSFLPRAVGDYQLTSTILNCNGNSDTVTGGSEGPVVAPVFLPGTYEALLAAPLGTRFALSYARVTDDWFRTETTVTVVAVKGNLPDIDGDGVLDPVDNCVEVPNPDQADADADDVGDACENLDRDGDGIGDDFDNCPDDANPDQRDLDGDFDGDVCDSDRDGDGIGNDVEMAIGSNPDTRDSDGDGIGDDVETNNGNAVDTDVDGVIDARDLDSDRDGLADAVEGTDDRDGDGVPNYRDSDAPLPRRFNVTVAYDYSIYWYNSFPDPGRRPLKKPGSDQLIADGSENVTITGANGEDVSWAIRQICIVPSFSTVVSPLVVSSPVLWEVAGVNVSAQPSSVWEPAIGQVLVPQASTCSQPLTSSLTWSPGGQIRATVSLEPGRDVDFVSFAHDSVVTVTLVDGQTFTTTARDVEKAAKRPPAVSDFDKTTRRRVRL